MKKFFLAAVFVFCLLFSAAAYGQEARLTIDSEPFDNKYYIADFSIYKIAESDFEMEQDFKRLDFSINSIKTAAQAEAAADLCLSYIKENDITYMDRKSAEKSVVFEELDEGYYFLSFNKTQNVNMESFIIGLPEYDSGAFNYDVVVFAKISADNVDEGSYNEDSTEVTTDEPSDEPTTSSGGGGGGGSDPDDPDDDDNSEPYKPSGGGGGDSYVIGGGETETRSSSTQTYQPSSHTDHSDKPSDDPSDEDEPSEPDTTDEPEEVSLDENGEPVEEVSLPKTGGDKTALLCDYCGGVLGIIGVLILIVNNVRRRSEA
ncbi:MAG: hypothetical protein LUG66_08930 [Clostridiales bacterium]|nr:hypothetical protein [Clostridiales bacterium]